MNLREKLGHVERFSVFCPHIAFLKNFFWKEKNQFFPRFMHIGGRKFPKKFFLKKSLFYTFHAFLIILAKKILFWKFFPALLVLISLAPYLITWQKFCPRQSCSPRPGAHPPSIGNPLRPSEPKKQPNIRDLSNC